MATLQGGAPAPQGRSDVVTERGLGLASYRLRSTFRRRWGGYLALVVLVGLIGRGISTSRQRHRCRQRTEPRAHPTAQRRAAGSRPGEPGTGRLQRQPGARHVAGRIGEQLGGGAGRPAEIVNYKTIGLTPAVLVSALALGAVVALALTLVSSVRQRRRDLALLKTIGFVRGQLAAAVAWQSSVAAVVGIVIGIPLGIVAGRWLWDLFARQIYAVPYSTVSLISLLLVGVGTLILANVVAAIPARTAARTSTAVMLRAE
jgi:hypothetical protein